MNKGADFFSLIADSQPKALIALDSLFRTLDLSQLARSAINLPLCVVCVTAFAFAAPNSQEKCKLLFNEQPVIFADLQASCKAKGFCKVFPFELLVNEHTTPARFYRCLPHIQVMSLACFMYDVIVCV